MPRNISFALTTDQFRARTKTVTRRLGWETLKAGDILMGCERCQGLKKGEKIKQLGPIRVVGVSRERYSGTCCYRPYPAIESSRKHTKGEQHDL